MDGLDGSLVVLGWDGRSLVPAGTGAPEQERHHWLAGHCKQGTNGTDGLDGALVGQGWDRQTLAPAGTVAPPWAMEQERHRFLLRGGTLCEVVPKLVVKRWVPPIQPLRYPPFQDHIQTIPTFSKGVPTFFNLLDALSRHRSCP